MNRWTYLIIISSSIVVIVVVVRAVSAAADHCGNNSGDNQSEERHEDDAVPSTNNLLTKRLHTCFSPADVLLASNISSTRGNKEGVRIYLRVILTSFLAHHYVCVYLEAK